MSYSEQRIVKQVTILPEVNAINVQWSNQVLRDDIVINETFERRAFMQKEKDEFLTMVDGAEAYAAAAGW